VLSVVFLSLLVVTAVVVGIFVMMFMDVAFQPHQTAMLIAGTNRGLRRGMGQGNVDGAELALKIGRTVGRAVRNMGLQPAVAATRDAACFQQEILVTIPEVLAISHELQERRSVAEVHEVQQQATLNLLNLNTAHNCPLLMSGGFCACEVARPVACRTHCTAGGDSPEHVRDLSRALEAGVTDVLQDCLQATGLDDGRYELNLALSQVLNSPHAARKWSRGERLVQSISS